MALHLGVMGALAAGTAFAGRFTLPLVGDPFQRTLGWRELQHGNGADPRDGAQPPASPFAR